MQNSSPRVPLLGVNSTHLETSFFQANHHKGQRLPIVLRLLAEGSVVVLVLALEWWGMATLGSSTLAHRARPSRQRSPPYTCPGALWSMRSSRAQLKGKRANAGAVLRKAPLIRPPHAD